MGREMDLAEMLGRMRGGNSDDEPTPTSDALVAEMTLRGDAFIQALTKIPFAVGDFVTPRKGCDHRGACLPMRVIEINADAQPLFLSSNIGSNSNGNRLQVRVITFGDGHYCPIWIEAGSLEPWTAPVAAAAPAPVSTDAPADQEPAAAA